MISRIDVICMVLLAMSYTMEGKVTKHSSLVKKGVFQDEVTELKDTVEVGCFADKDNDRVFGQCFKNYRSIEGLWKMYPNFTEISEMCADTAKRLGFKYFGIEYYGECWSGKVNGEWKYDKHGRVDKCIGRVGKDHALRVYKFKGCYLDGEFYADGAEMPTTDFTDPCVTRCKCSDGERLPYAKQCPYFDTNLCDTIKKESDGCCSYCACEQNEVVMEEESTWKNILSDGTCSTCTCKDGKAECGFLVNGCAEPTARPTLPPATEKPTFEFP